MSAALSPNHDERPAGTPIDMLVLHYTGMRSGGEAQHRLCDPAARVSAHYLIDEAGAVAELVPEHRRAWHAGVSYWRGHRDINARSIGIEIVNPGHEFGYRAFPAPQIDAVVDLCTQVLSRHSIPARNVVGHSDIAPSRKRDPGELFPWKQLATAGVGMWPAPGGTPASAVDTGPLLHTYGYDPDADLDCLVAAFQRHFRPAKINGTPDPETLGRLNQLLAAA